MIPKVLMPVGALGLKVAKPTSRVLFCERALHHHLEEPLRSSADLNKLHFYGLASEAQSVREPCSRSATACREMGDGRNPFAIAPHPSLQSVSMALGLLAAGAVDHYMTHRRCQKELSAVY